MLDTDQLRSFLAIVDTGSFTRAGERVNKTQSAVSMHIRRLEEQLGCALFVKQGRSARLTAEGEKLIEYARHMIQIEAGAVAALSRRGLRGSVRFGIPDDYAESFLSGILTSFNRRHPLVEVAVICENSVELGAQVKAGAIDIALVTDHEELQNFELVREEPLVWAASKRFTSTAGAQIPLAVGSPTCLWRRVLDVALRDRPSATHGLFSSKNYTAIGSVVRAGLAATVLPIGMVGDDLRVLGKEDGLPPLPLTRMGLIRASGRQSPEASAFAEAIRDAIGGAGTRKVA